MTAIFVNDLTFAYDGSDDVIFDHVNLALDSKWKLGLIGRNGRGKTTFLHLLEGSLNHGGAIVSSVPFFYFSFVPRDIKTLTLEVVEDLSNALLWQIQRELSFLQMEDEVLYRPFDTLSHGERTKVLLAALFLKEDGFLLIDEPTNHLDIEGRKVVSDYLNRKEGFIVVSHDRAFLDGCVNYTLSIERNGIRVRKGTFSQWQTEKDMEDAWEIAEHEKHRRETKRLSDAARRAEQWSIVTEKSKKKKNGPSNSGSGKLDRGYLGHQAAKMMKRAKTIETRREEALEQQKALLKNLDTAEVLKMHPLAYHGERLAYGRGLIFSYDKKQICGPLSFELCRGDRWVLQGRNGAGKSTFLQLLVGNCQAQWQGEFSMGSNITISYVPQDADGLDGTVHAMAKVWGIDETLWITNMRKLGIERRQFERDLSEWSSGQKKKAMLARSLSEEAHLYLWDEPLNYLDFISRLQLEELLKQYGPTLVLVEHDAAFCREIATKELLF